MRGYQKVGPRQLEGLYIEAQAIVQQFADAQNPSLGLVAYTEVTEGAQSMTMKVKGANKVRVGGIVDALNEQIPGSDMIYEITPNASNLYVEVPTLETNHPNNNSNRQRHVIPTPAGKPSTEWGMFLVMVEVILGTAIWYRFSSGISGFF
jgi:hypothetical protein